MKEIKLKIGEIAKLCNVTNRTLRHYEEIGLLVPGILDDFTGYRYYGPEEILKLRYINYFKEYGMSLSEVKEMFESEKLSLDIYELEKYLRKCELEMEKITKRYNCLKSLIENQRKWESQQTIYFDNYLL